MKKRILAALLCAVMLLALIACGGGGGGKSDTPVTGSETETEATEAPVTKAQPKAPAADYDGYEFSFLAYDYNKANGISLPENILVEEQNGDPLNDAVYERNSLVSEALNIKIANTLSTGDSATINKFSQDVLAGTNEFDMFIMAAYKYSAVVTPGYCMNVYELPYIDWTDPWWDTATLEELTICNKIFGFFSDITFMDKYATYAMYVNKKLAEDYGIGDFYGMVLDNKWTLDKLLELSSNISADLNGDGKFDRNDAYGLLGQNDTSYVMLHAFGERICRLDGEGIPYASINSERAVTVCEKLIALLADNERFFNRQTNGNLNVQDAINMFIGDQALFMQRPLFSVEMMREMESDYGLIPSPKFDEAQEEWGNSVNLWVACATFVPVTCQDNERLATIIERIAAVSNEVVLEPFYKTVLGVKFTRDAQSADMLDIIFASRVYDVGNVFNFGNYAQGVFLKIGSSGATTIVSSYESSASKIQADIDKLVEALTA